MNCAAGVERCIAILLLPLFFVLLHAGDVDWAGFAAGLNPTAAIGDIFCNTAKFPHSSAEATLFTEREREKERGKPLPSPVKIRENGDERTMSMVVETNASPQISHRSSVDGVALHKQKQTVLLVRPERGE